MSACLRAFLKSSTLADAREAFGYTMIEWGVSEWKALRSAAYTRLRSVFLITALFATFFDTTTLALPRADVVIAMVPY